MNPLVRSQLQEINRQIDALKHAVAATKERAAKASGQQGRVLQEQWRHRKELATLKHASEDYQTLRDENEKLRTVHAQLAERLESVLSHAKALSNEFHS